MAAVLESLCLQAALEYAALGWRVVPLHTVVGGNCTCGNRRGCEHSARNRGKHPRVKEWQKEATTSEEKIAQWFDRWPESNVGVQMGPSSKIIDFETDSDEGERNLAELFGGSIPAVPMFQSDRGRHRLFSWRDDLPSEATVPLGWGDVKLGSGEKGSQCVFPPSRHHTGKQYRWLIRPSEADPAPLPDRVVAWLWNRDGAQDGSNPRKSPEHWRKLGEGVAEGFRNQAVSSLIGGLLRGASDIESASALELLYQATCGINQGNTPPLDDREIKATFESILRKERQRRATEAADSVLSRTPEERIAEATKTGVKAPESMKLVIVREDPPKYLIYSPQFHKARDGCVRLTASQICSFALFRVQALEQADYLLPNSFRKPWEARGGIFEQLIFSAEEREASTVTKRLATAAEYLLGRLTSATARADGKNEPDQRKPVRMDDGTVWFRWAETWKDALFDGLVNREEPKRVADFLGMGPACAKFFPARGAGRRRYVVFGKDLMEKLVKLAEAEDV